MNIRKLLNGRCTFDVWSFLARPGDQSLDGMLKLTLWRRMYNKWLFRQSMKIVECYIEEELKSWRSEMAELKKKKATEPLNPTDAAHIKELSKRFNEIARLMMGASMSSRSMMYDKRCFTLMAKNLDYNSLQMFYYLLGETKVDE